MPNREHNFDPISGYCFNCRQLKELSDEQCQTRESLLADLKELQAVFATAQNNITDLENTLENSLRLISRLQSEKGHVTKHNFKLSCRNKDLEEENQNLRDYCKRVSGKGDEEAAKKVEQLTRELNDMRREHIIVETAYSRKVNQLEVQLNNVSKRAVEDNNWQLVLEPDLLVYTDLNTRAKLYQRFSNLLNDSRLMREFKEENKELHVQIRMLSQKAELTESDRQRSEAWGKVFCVLTKVLPNWRHNHTLSASDYAVKAIETLAEEVKLLKDLSHSSDYVDFAREVADIVTEVEGPGRNTKGILIRLRKWGEDSKALRNILEAVKQTGR